MVVTAKLSDLPRATVSEAAEVMTAVFEVGTTVADGAEAALVPSALVASR